MRAGAVAGIIALTFSCAYLDLTVGMGYGTILTPILLFVGFSPMQVVPLSARSTRLIGMRRLKLAVAIITIVVGTATITGALAGSRT